MKSKSTHFEIIDWSDPINKDHPMYDPAVREKMYKEAIKESTKRNIIWDASREDKLNENEKEI